jgi:hypothetical protein
MNLEDLRQCDKTCQNLSNRYFETCQTSVQLSTNGSCGVLPSASTRQERHVKLGLRVAQRNWLKHTGVEQEPDVCMCVSQEPVTCLIGTKAHAEVQ